MCADVCRIFFGLSRKFNVYVSIQWTAVFYIIFHHVSISHMYFKYSQKRASILPKSFIQYVFFFRLLLLSFLFQSGCYLFLCCPFLLCAVRSLLWPCYILTLFIYIVLFASRYLYWDCIRLPHCVFSVIFQIAGRRYRQFMRMF